MLHRAFVCPSGVGLAVALFVASVSVLGCHETEVGTRGTPERTHAGDTLVLTTLKSAPIHRVDSVEITYYSEELDLPRRLTANSRFIVVADRWRLHLISLTGNPARQIGRNGEGPGEYRLVTAVQPFSSDSIAVYDAALHRLSVLSPNGEFVRSIRIPVLPPFVNPAFDSNVLTVSGNQVLLLQTTNVDTRQQPSVTAAVTGYDLAEDTASILTTFPERWFRAIGMRWLSPIRLFPNRMLIDVSADFRIAHGDGMEYCVTIDSVMSVIHKGSIVQRICRSWTRPAVGKGIRAESFSDMPGDEETRRDLRRILSEQEIPDRMPSYDLIRFGQDGRLWVRTVPPELADIHPVILGRFPERGPSHRSWDVFDQTGTLLVTEQLPAQFMPWTMRSDTALGMVTLPSGEVAVATAHLAPSLRRSVRSDGK